MTIKKEVLLTFVILLLALLIRGFKLGSNPPGLYWEEVALGYDAYSIWKTGADHHGNPWPIVAFESFGDWKPSLYFYVTAPFVGLLGLNSVTVRLPSLIAGMAIVYGAGVLANLVFKSLTQQNNQKIKLLGMLVTALNPWAIHFSRAAWEVNLATALILWGVISGLLFLNSNKIKHLIYCSFLLILSMYTYHSARILAPVLGLSILVSLVRSFNNWPQLKKYVITNQLSLLALLLISLMVLAPLITNLTNKSITQRFAETSIFSNLEIIQLSNDQKEFFNNSLISKLIFHRYLLFGREVVHNFLSHFDFKFLFVSGDINPRHSIQSFAHFYYLDLIFLLAGAIVFLKNKKNPVILILLTWLIIGILPASITTGSPHALRILPTLPVFIVLIVLGITLLYNELKKIIAKKFFKTYQLGFTVGLVLVYLFFFSWYYHAFMLIYPTQYASEWQAQYPALIAQVQQLQAQQPNSDIIISREWGRPAMYYWFYTQTDPREVQAVAKSVKKDQGEFLEFKQLQFTSQGFSQPNIMVQLKDENINTTN